MWYIKKKKSFLVWSIKHVVVLAIITLKRKIKRMGDGAWCPALGSGLVHWAFLWRGLGHSTTSASSLCTPHSSPTCQFPFNYCSFSHFLFPKHPLSTPLQGAFLPRYWTGSVSPKPAKFLEWASQHPYLPPVQVIMGDGTPGLTCFWADGPADSFTPEVVVPSTTAIAKFGAAFGTFPYCTTSVEWGPGRCQLLWATAYVWREIAKQYCLGACIAREYSRHVPRLGTI